MDGLHVAPSEKHNILGESTSFKVHYHGEVHDLSLPPASTLQDLSALISEVFHIPAENQKLLISPKPGLQKFPFSPILLSSFPVDSSRFKITLLGSTASEITSLNKSISDHQRQQHQRRESAIKSAKPLSTHRTQVQSSLSSQYTFHRLLPLPYLPNPDRSLAYLVRLRDDPGIRAAMTKHRFSVPLLTEMNPVEHTTLSSRTLGLNRNKGEAIELRLRTDAYDGYRDYRTIRKTLCHELAHCVHSEHDRDFWNLTARIEKEVQSADYWGKGGKRLTEEEFYNPADWEEMKSGGEVMDHGGWTGGEFVLGGLGGTGSAAGAGLSRREILARAAESRMSAKSKEKNTDEGGSDTQN
ncbi:zinc metalloproteinase [Coccidioides immitis RS]|uniref:Zinc metalloproteinase n=3 Tax=Coccidioides immitis TaxID=5501 RepID=J3K934_COCIM|nr:zinc metalloproteinase [Coccidioides immitis RS]EAS31380.3 zinc metalloproteinase [Coccidioides immitis RS]KMP04020.1 ubiquitin/metalloprotease fusion protein [Coccidioides immitis RMSCC 2394]KMU86173.1 ubiquitin/metalloprotease fusion protein [Coccidioides immitis H538.4]TPX24182.1 hypothetical protein DIZ76_013525 [Coccidioides immitis]